MSKARKHSLRSKAAKAWTPPKATPYASLGPSEPTRITTECGGTAQPKPVTVRSDGYLDWIRKQPCALHGGPWGCGIFAEVRGFPFWMTAIDASHHPAKGDGSTGKKRHDFRCLPLCKAAHHEHHKLNLELTRDWIEAQLWAHIARRRETLSAYTGTIPVYVRERYEEE